MDALDLISRLALDDIYHWADDRSRHRWLAIYHWSDNDEYIVFEGQFQTSTDSSIDEKHIVT